MNKHIRIVESVMKKQRLNPAYQPSAAEIQASHKASALLARIVMNNPKAGHVTGALAPVCTGSLVYRQFGGCHE